MMDFTNADRAKRAKAALKRYNRDNDPITNAVDLLTDLQHFYHLAHAQDYTHPTFDEALVSARGHFEAEQQGEDSRYKPTRSSTRKMFRIMRQSKSRRKAMKMR
jgi:hypothetical protein